MYPPFEFNNLLGPLMALGLFAGAIKCFLLCGALGEFFRREEASYKEQR